MQYPTAEDLKNRKAIPEGCKDCEKTEEIEGSEFCKLYLNPTQWWQKGNPFRWKCPAATHFNPEKNVEHKRLNPLKASKLSQKGGIRLGYRVRRYVHTRTRSKKKYVDGLGG